MMNAIRKKTESVSYNESKLLKPSGYIDTGCYAVNKIISGNVYNGIPEGRITTFFGESGCVPEDRKIKVLVRVNEVNSRYLETRTGYSNSEFTCSYSKKIEWLEHIGYSLCEISKEIKLSRQTLIKIKNNKIGEIRYASKQKIDSFLDRNSYNCSIGNINNIIDNSNPVLIKTPNTHTTCSHLIKKGPKECLVITTRNFQLECSIDHLVKNITRDWVFAENLIKGDFILTEFGSEEILSVEKSGIKECVDIEMFDDDHCYYIDGIPSHNSGKSRIVAQIITNALTKNNYDVIFYFDSEGGALYDLIKNSGADLNKIEHIVIANTEEATIKMLSTYTEIENENRAITEKNIEIGKKNDEIIKKNEKNKKKIEAGEAKAEPLIPLETFPKILAVLDSFGMLVSNKLLVDATEKDKMVSDMGSSARAKNNFIKAMTIPVLKTNAALIILNHIYDDPSAMYASKIKNQPGGKGLQFASCVILQSTKSLDKNEKKEGLEEGNSYFKGNMIKYFTTKNRLVKLGYEAEMFVDLNYGISKYDGLIEDAKRYGYIIGPSKARYTVPSFSKDEKLTYNDLLTRDDVWDTFIKEFNEKCEQDMQYGSGDGQMIEREETDEDDDNLDDSEI
jgi:RecA/RadA recombinase